MLVGTEHIMFKFTQWYQQDRKMHTNDDNLTQSLLKVRLSSLKMKVS